MIYQKLEELVGNTPLLALHRMEAKYQLAGALFAKLEGCNPAGSVKDRVALSMIQDAEQQGRLKPGATILEPTSGNTGIGLACFAAIRGYRLILIMPDSMSAERRAMMSAYGAELILTPGSAGMQGAVDRAQELAAQIPNSFLPSQFTNPANPEAHYRTTGPELWKGMEGKIDCFLSAVGTGGTISGVGRFLKEQNPQIQVVAIEPAGSPLLSGGEAGPHKIQGIGANFIPETLDTTIYDQVIPVRDEDAFAMGRELAQTEGVMGGISSGAVLWAGIQLAQKPSYEGKRLVMILPDLGDRYLSSPMFAQ